MLGYLRAAVDVVEPGERKHGRCRQQHTDRDERAFNAEPRDEHRRHDRSDRDAQECDHFERAEHAPMHTRRRYALDQRQPGDVEHPVPQTGDRQEDERGDLMRDERNERKRRSPQNETEPRRRREPASADERKRGERADEIPNAERRVEISDPGVSHVHEPYRHEDNEDVQRTSGKRLPEEEREHEAQIALPRDRLDAFDRLMCHRAHTA